MAEESPLLQSAVAAWSRRKDPSVFAAEDTRMRHTSIYVASLGGRARLISKVHLVIFGRTKFTTPRPEGKHEVFKIRRHI